MDLSQIAASLPVHSGQPLRLPKGFGHRIAVLDGNVWITQGDPRDIVLSAGQDVVVERPTATVVSALGGDARIMDGTAA